MVKDNEYYLITNEKHTDKLWSYSSENSLLDDDKIYDFLQKSEVIK